MSSPLGTQGITEQDIADYLVNTPAFFERHAELLASIQLTSPHGQRAVSLQERQMEMLRDKLKGMERKVMEMIRHGQDNSSIADKLHHYTLNLMLTRDVHRLPDVVIDEIKHLFLVPQAALRLWSIDAAHAKLPFAAAVDDDVKSFASSLQHPYCGVNSGFEAATWAEDPAAVASLALVPLRLPARDGAFGLLVFASPDPTRYAHDMGTEFLSRIGETASAALSRLLP